MSKSQGQPRILGLWGLCSRLYNLNGLAELLRGVPATLVSLLPIIAPRAVLGPNSKLATWQDYVRASLLNAVGVLVLEPFHAMHVRGLLLPKALALPAQTFSAKALFRATMPAEKVNKSMDANELIDALFPLGPVLPLISSLARSGLDALEKIADGAGLYSALASGAWAAALSHLVLGVVVDALGLVLGTLRTKLILHSPATSNVGGSVSPSSSAGSQACMSHFETSSRRSSNDLERSHTPTPPDSPPRHCLRGELTLDHLLASRTRRRPLRRGQAYRPLPATPFAKSSPSTRQTPLTIDLLKLAPLHPSPYPAPAPASHGESTLSALFGLFGLRTIPHIMCLIVAEEGASALVRGWECLLAVRLAKILSWGLSLRPLRACATFV